MTHQSGGLLSWTTGRLEEAWANALYGPPDVTQRSTGTATCRIPRLASGM
jgi:hypothetical protein